MRSPEWNAKEGVHSKESSRRWVLGRKCHAGGRHGSDVVLRRSSKRRHIMERSYLRCNELAGAMPGTVTTKRILQQGCRRGHILMRARCHLIRVHRPKQGQQENSTQEVDQPEHADTLVPSDTIWFNHNDVSSKFASIFGESATHSLVCDPEAVQRET